MKRATLAAVLLALLVSVAGTFVASTWYFGQQTFAEGVVVSTMRSAVLGEEREVIVHPPESYNDDPNRRYPVIYVLDGSSQDIHTASSAALMARLGLMPELIVVGIPNVGGEGRERDLTPPFMGRAVDDPTSAKGAGDRFLAFIKNELIPDIDRRYRTTPVRMLMGHSRGGLLAAYSLMAEPDLFQARFVHSAPVWRYDAIMAKKVSEYLATRPASASFFYMSVGSKETGQMIGGYERFRSVLAAEAPPNLRWHAERIPGAVHGNNGEWATPLGFRALYRDRTTDPVSGR